MIPICYEEGLVGGAAPGCADLLTVAVEAYMKELLADIYSRVRSNGVNYVQTAAWRKKYRREEGLADRKELQRNAVGLLPCEADVGREKKPLGLMDLRLALETGNTYLSQVRLVSDRIVVGEQVDDEEEDRSDDDEPSSSAMAPRVNGMTSTMTNGTHDEDVVMEDVDLVWLGGSATDREALGSVLDDCLAIGLS
jgi:transcriptional coactivator HFI1/ADA1